MVYKCVIWGTGKIFWRELNVIKYHEMCKRLEIVAVTSKDASLHNIAGYPFVLSKDLFLLQYDFIIVMTEKITYQEIKKDATWYNIDINKMVFWEVFSRNEIDLQKYFYLRQNPVSIFSNNCWGGITYNKLDLQFSSPLVNMCMTGQDYMKLLKDPYLYINATLQLKELRKRKDAGIMYPVVRCADIELVCNHYTSFEEVELCWERRKKRINWDNLFVMMYTSNQKEAVEFSELPYSKKICFVPFEQKDSCCFDLNFSSVNGEMKDLWEKVIKIAKREKVLYDDIELLCTGKIDKLNQ